MRMKTLTLMLGCCLMTTGMAWADGITKVTDEQARTISKEMVTLMRDKLRDICDPEGLIDSKNTLTEAEKACIAAATTIQAIRACTVDRPGNEVISETIRPCIRQGENATVRLVQRRLGTDIDGGGNGNGGGGSTTGKSCKFDLNNATYAHGVRWEVGNAIYEGRGQGTCHKKRYVCINGVVVNEHSTSESGYIFGCQGTRVIPPENK